MRAPVRVGVADRATGTFITAGRTFWSSVEVASTYDLSSGALASGGRWLVGRHNVCVQGNSRSWPGL